MIIFEIKMQINIVFRSEKEGKKMFAELSVKNIQKKIYILNNLI